jgi:hypothetical protein
MGMLTKVTIVPKLSKLVMRLAIIKPIQVKPTVINIIMGIAKLTPYKVSGTAIIIPSKITISPWNMAAVPTPNILPAKMEVRPIGATNISFIKPNCRSQITEIPRNIAVKRSVCAIIPGRRNCR